jgi:hypothetical protein
MYTWVTRTVVLCMLVLPALASCAGDDDDSTPAAQPCMPGLMSTMFIGGMNDPCPQDMADPTTGKIICPTQMGYMAVSQCMPDGKWQYPCQCIQKPGVCGNGKKEGTEACDAADLGGASCQTVMGATSKGTLVCSPSCTLVTTGCMSGAPPVGGAGG